MRNKIILNLAMSLDGYIADEDGGYAWIRGNGDSRLNTPEKWDFQAFLRRVDAVVMGHACYDQNMHTEFAGKRVFVATGTPHPDVGNVRFIGGDVVGRILEERERADGDIYLFGGGKLADAFLKSDVVDEFIIGVIPMLLGKGRPLFYGNNPMVELKLIHYIVEDGVVILRYVRNEA